MAIRDIPRNIANLFRNVRYRLGGTVLTEWSIPPGWGYRQYLAAYGEVGWLFGAVSLIAQAVAQQEWHLYIQGNKKEYTEVDEHPLRDLLYKVNPFQTRYQFIQMAQTYIGLTGECFIILDFNRLSVPSQMWIAPPGYMYVVPDRTNYISHYEFRRGGEVIQLEIPEVIHILDPNPANPYRGIGTASAVGVDVDSERYAARYQQRLFFNDGRPGLALEIPGDMPPSEDERRRFMEQWNKQYRGWGNAYKTAFLWGGMKLNNVTMTNRDMDFKELRKTNRDIILGAYHIPESLIGASEVGSRARAEADEYIFSKYVVRPALQRFKEAFNEQLCPLFDERLVLDFDDPVPEDRAALIDEVDRMVRAGVYTREFAINLLGHSIDDMKGGTYLLPMSILPETAKQLLPAKVKSILPEEKADAYWRGYAQKTEAQERAFRQTLGKLFDEQRNEVIDNLKRYGNGDFNYDKAVRTFAEAFKPLIRDVYAAHFEDVGKDILGRSVNRQLEEFLDAYALEWISSRAMSLARMVNGTNRDQLRAVLAEGYREGIGLDELTKRIKQFYQNGYERRAPLVARTEVIAAANEGALHRYETEGVKKAQFYTALDERTCDECYALHGHEYPISETHGVIPVHPQCRCTFLPIVD